MLRKLIVPKIIVALFVLSLVLFLLKFECHGEGVTNLQRNLGTLKEITGQDAPHNKTRTHYTAADGSIKSAAEITNELNSALSFAIGNSPDSIFGTSAFDTGTLIYGSSQGKVYGIGNVPSYGMRGSAGSFIIYMDVNGVYTDDAGKSTAVNFLAKDVKNALIKTEYNGEYAYAYTDVISITSDQISEVKNADIKQKKAANQIVEEAIMRTYGKNETVTASVGTSITLKNSSTGYSYTSNPNFLETGAYPYTEYPLTTVYVKLQKTIDGKNVEFVATLKPLTIHGDMGCLQYAITDILPANTLRLRLKKEIHSYNNEICNSAVVFDIQRNGKTDQELTMDISKENVKDICLTGKNGDVFSISETRDCYKTIGASTYQMTMEEYAPVPEMPGYKVMRWKMT